MKEKDFIKDLNLILKIEYGAVLQYVLHTYRLVKSGEKEEANELMVLVNDEIRHAETLANKIRSLGGKPTTATKWTSTADDLQTMLEINLATERKSITIYEKLIKISEKEGLMGIKSLLEDQLADEVKHVKLLQNYPSK